MAAIPRLQDIARAALVAVACAAACSARAAQAPESGAERPRAQAARTAERIRVDGVLDDPAWAAAPPITGLRLAFVNEGAVPCESTTVRVVLEDDAIAFGIQVTNRSPGAIRASLAPRDGILDGDHVAIHLDTYRDRRRAYVFGVNPYGVELDGLLTGPEPDLTWDAVWDAAARRDSSGWSAEMRIPLRALRFPRGGGGTWGLWIRQEIHKRDQICTWPTYRLAVQGDIMRQAGDLAGLDGLRGGGAVEAEPYVASTWDAARGPDAASFDRWRDSRRADAGLDLRWGLTSTLTANATANPDFSQVEADALQLGLNRRFPLRYDEKRPFFLEGKDLFELPLELVYTRRIADPDAGGKLIGRVGALRLGVIAAHDQGGAAEEGIGAGESDVPAPRGDFGIARGALDVGEHSSVGFLVAAHLRTDDSPSAARPWLGPPTTTLGGHNLVAALDGRVTLGEHLVASGMLATSATRIDSTIVDSVRHGGERRFSDLAGHGEIVWGDGTRTLELRGTYLGPDFRTESGFLERVDVAESAVEGQWRFERPAPWMRVWTPEVEVTTVHDTRGGMQEVRIQPGADWDLEGQTFLYTGLWHSRERWRSRDYDLDLADVYASCTRWRGLELSLDAEVGDGIFYGATDAESFLGWQEVESLAATLRPSPRLTAALTGDRRRFARAFEGPTVFDVWALGAKTTWQFTRRLYARAYPQYDTGTRHLDLDLLLGYVVHPGTVAYLGLSGDMDRVNGTRRDTRRTLFLKLSYRFGV